MPVHLARRTRDLVDVEHRDGVPTAFVRGGRRHTVRRVLAHWWETGPWWAGDLTDGVHDDEREHWRVEATSSGRPLVVLDLCLAWSTGRWTVTAVDD